MLTSDFEVPVFVVQHLHPSDDGAFARHLSRISRLIVVEPCDKERIECGRIYAAPANYHMLVNRNGTISLSVDEKVNWSRPSIDVLFESAANAWREGVVAVLLSGASADGAKGMRSVKEAGGLTIAQDPASAEISLMPQSAIDAKAADKVLQAEEIGRLLAEIGANQQYDSPCNTQSEICPGEHRHG
jgi:two-component system chemotaxis response regulator CheB